MTISGDGTARGLVQISITYSLGVVVALISTTTLWLACSQLSKEIETYNIHLVVSKPCPKWCLWVGKWFGIFIMHTVILLVSAALIYVLIQARVKYDTSKGRFTQAEIERLDTETRVGRRGFVAEVADYDKMAQDEYEKKVAEGEYKGRNPEEVLAEIKRQILAKDGEVKNGNFKVWVFKNVKGKDDPMLYLRYRVYSGSTSANDQHTLPCLWGVRDPSAPADVSDPFYNLPMSIMGGTYQEIKLNQQCIDKEHDNTVIVRYYNPPVDSEVWGGVEPSSAMFQAKDGPIILVAVSSFLENYCRAMILAIFQIAFLAALGCTVSAAFSTPVAAFVAVAYLVIGLMVQPAIDAPLKNALGNTVYKGFHDKAAHYLAKGIDKVVVSVDDLDATSDLAVGKLVENDRLLDSFLTLLILKTGLISAVGIWIINKRELGLVIRK